MFVCACAGVRVLYRDVLLYCTELFSVLLILFCLKLVVPDRLFSGEAWRWRSRNDE